MRIENRELYAAFYSDEDERGRYGLIVGWTDDLLPLVAYNYGVHKLVSGFNVFTSKTAAKWNSEDLRGS